MLSVREQFSPWVSVQGIDSGMAGNFPLRHSCLGCVPESAFKGATRLAQGKVSRRTPGDTKGRDVAARNESIRKVSRKAPCNYTRYLRHSLKANVRGLVGENGKHSPTGADRIGSSLFPLFGKGEVFSRFYALGNYS